MAQAIDGVCLETEGLAVRGIIADLQQHWPDAVALEPGRSSEYYALPYLLREALPRLGAQELRPLAVFCKLYAGSIFLQDRLVDGPLHAGAEPGALATGSLRIMAMQLEAYRQLHAMFGSGAAFWGRLRDYVADYTAALVEEQRFASGRPWREYTEAMALGVVRDKNGPARIIAAGMVELAGDDRPLTSLLEIINAFNLATQMWDDLQDWKDDLRQGTPSLLLARLCPERPPPCSGDDWHDLTRQLARELYYHGHADRVLDLALSALDTAEQLKPTIPDLGLHGRTAMLRGWCNGLRGDIQRIVRANLSRARAQPRLALRLPAAAAPWQDVAFGALGFLEAQWNLGFGEGRDLMRYPAELGFGAGDTCYFGDVFQRALLADALCDADRVLGGRLRPIIQREAEYLVSQRLPSPTGGWRYYANLPELPPDADDLAQVMQALIRADRRDDVARHGEASLGVLLRDNSHPDGSFETWIVPASGRTELEDRHAVLVERVWGAGADCDVIPNLLYALELYDAARFAEIAQRGATYLEREQRRDGTWPSRWYAGPYYAIYVCLRMFAAVRPRSSAVPRALAVLRDTQRGDGGWGIDGGASDPLMTALALLGLAAAQPAHGEPADRERAARGIELLRDAMASDGGWPAQQLIFKGLRAFHGSRTLTTTFALKAALAWQDQRADAAIARTA